MSYLSFVKHIITSDISVIFELGSRDLLDAIALLNYFSDAEIYSFECNPDCLIECNKNLASIHSSIKNKLHLIDNAVSINDDDVLFFPFDLTKYNNMGSSSMLKIDFSKRNKFDPDFNIDNPQKEIIVKGTRLDSFMNTNKIIKVDLLCIDLQGYELKAIQSLGTKLQTIKYIITECSICNTYIDGASFVELNDYLTKNNFKYVTSNAFGNKFPNILQKGFSEFDALFINTLI